MKILFIGLGSIGQRHLINAKKIFKNAKFYALRIKNKNLIIKDAKLRKKGLLGDYYNIQIVIKATETKSGTNYAIKSPKDGPKSFVFSKKILLDRYGSKVAQRANVPKTAYQDLDKIKKFVNEIKRELAIIKL